MNRLRLMAEIGVNHDGSCARAVEMTRAAAACGFDMVKLQYWNVDELLADLAPNADYQGPGDQHELLAGLRLGLDELAVVKRTARDAGVGFVVTPDGARACRELIELGVDALKIGSGDADNPWLLEEAARSGLPVIASTGMMLDDEVHRLVDRLSSVEDVTLLHCVSAYPTPLEEAGLRRLRWLSDAAARPIGFSDHTVGIAAAAAAVALGAVMVEKHVTWSASATGPDHAMSLPLDEAAGWASALRGLESGLTSPGASAAEIANRAVVRKGLYVTRDIARGDVVRSSELLPLRPLGDGIAAGDRDALGGRRARRDLAAGQRLRWDDLEP